jgi:RNA polymerase sigma-70 factor (ECF subfamily)
MSPNTSFHDLQARLRAGSDSAASDVFHRFASRLIALARTRLDSRLRRETDPEDVVQSVFKSFFLHYADGKFELKDWGGLWALLVVITVRKCSRKNKRIRPPISDIGDHLSMIPDREPTPLETIELLEMMDLLFKGLKRERDRQILTLHLQELTVPEIAKQVGRTKYTVEGVLRRVRNRAMQMWDP